MIFIADREGVYALDHATGNLQIVVDKPITAGASLFYGESFSDGFIVDTQEGLEHYRLQPIEVQSRPDISTNRALTPRIVFEKVATYPKLPEDSNAYWSLAIAPNGTVAALANAPFGQERLADYPNLQRPSMANQWFGLGTNRKLSAMATELSSQYKIATLSPQQPQWSVEIVGMKSQAAPPNRNAFAMAGLLGATPLVPTAVVASIVVSSSILESGTSTIGNLLSLREGQQVLQAYMLCLLAAILVAALWSYFLLRKRSTDKKFTLLWLALAIPLGLAAPIAIIALYPKLVFEHCSKCDRMRSVNRSRCEHCGTGWESLPSQGVEIIESQRLPSLSNIS